MKEIPIIFNALLAPLAHNGAKTQTRRIFKDQPSADDEIILERAYGWEHTEDRKLACLTAGDQCYEFTSIKMPYCRDDILWVRENYKLDFNGYGCIVHYVDRQTKECLDEAGPDPEWHQQEWVGHSDLLIERGWECVTEDSSWTKKRGDRVETDYMKEVRWRPSIFMPKWASRTKLKVLNVRLEYLHNITEEDALAEGVSQMMRSSFGCSTSYSYEDFCKNEAIDTFKRLWKQINGIDSWSNDQRVWVVEFKKWESE